jgi:peptidoglycan hydrolase CwlO-like protein
LLKLIHSNKNKTPHKGKENNNMTKNMMENLNEIENTQTLLEKLAAEQNDLSAKMAIAASDADSASLISLAHKRNNIPIELLSTQIILQQLLLQRDELRLPELQSTVAELAKPIPEMQKQIAEMQREFNIASGAVSNANENLRQTKLKSLSENGRLKDFCIRRETSESHRHLCL